MYTFEEKINLLKCAAYALKKPKGIKKPKIPKAEKSLKKPESPINAILTAGMMAGSGFRGARNLWYDAQFINRIAAQVEDMAGRVGRVAGKVI